MRRFMMLSYHSFFTPDKGPGRVYGVVLTRPSLRTGAKAGMAPLLVPLENPIAPLLMLCYRIAGFGLFHASNEISRGPIN